jgi:leucine dehydrogenase
LKSYAEKVNLLGGHFVTGADVGINREDVITMHRYSPYFVGVNVDPVRFTGLGLFYSVQACLKEVFGTESLKGRSFAIQGVGKIGSELLKYIYPYTHNVNVADINKSALEDVLIKYPDVKVVDTNKIFNQKVDVFSPCALSSCLNKQTIKLLKCSVVVGGANNQLEDDSISDKLNKIGILYAPDYVVNSGGLISVYAEYEKHGSDTVYIEKKVKRIKATVKKILEISKRSKISTLTVSNRIAEERMMKLK